MASPCVGFSIVGVAFDAVAFASITTTEYPLVRKFACRISATSRVWQHSIRAALMACTPFRLGFYAHVIFVIAFDMGVMALC